MSLNKIRPRDVTRDCIAVRMRMADRVITKIYDDALRPFGLSVNQFAMLAIGESRGYLRQADICEDLQLNNSTLSRNLERMRANGWLKQMPGKDDRENLHEVTSEGQRLLNTAIPVWSEAQEKARGLLGDSGVEALWEFASKQEGI